MALAMGGLAMSDRIGGAAAQAAPHIEQLAPELDKIIVEQTEKWGKVIRTANIKPE